MPKPHYTPQGGPYLPAWTKPTSGVAATSERDQKPAEAGQGHTFQPRTTSNALRITHHAPQPQEQPRWLASHPGKASVKMVWVTLGICGAVLLFALVALLRHG